MSMNTQEVKQYMEENDESAWLVLLSEIPTAERRFKRLTKALAELLKDVKKEFPEAQYYTGSGGFNLMIGASHGEGGDSKSQAPNSQLVALSASAYLRVGDGDF
ncbi:hypothetical protein [Serratia fonticola]